MKATATYTELFRPSTVGQERTYAHPIKPIERFPLSSLEEVWAYREETLYPALFGAASRGIFPLNFELFSEIFAQEDVDPRWLHLGILEYEPTPSRSSWLYVSSGGSTPWDTEPGDYNVTDYSWLGVEFVIEAPSQANWPIRALQRLLAYQVLLTHRRLGNYAPLDYGHRLPAGGAVDGSRDSKLTFLAIAKPTHYPSSASLQSGKFDFLHVVGITEQERDFAKATSTEELIAKLSANSAFPITDPGRLGMSVSIDS